MKLIAILCAVIMAWAVPLAAQTYLCEIDGGGLLAGTPRSFQVTYEPAGTAVVQHDWQGAPYAVRVDIDEGYNYRTSHHRIRFEPPGRRSVIVVFRLSHHLRTHVFQMETRYIGYGNYHQGTGVCRLV